MAAPTVEMGLGGSLRALAASHVPDAYAYSDMRVYQGVVNYNTYPYTFEDRVAASFQQIAPVPQAGAQPREWLQPSSYVTVFGSPGTNDPSVLPEGGGAIVCDGAADYLRYPTATGPGIEPCSIEVVVNIAAVPGVGVEPAVWGCSDFGLTYQDDGKVHVYYDGTDVLDATVATGGTVHLVLTRTGASPDVVTLYVNGSASSATPAQASLVITPLYAGKHWTNAHYLSATYYFLSVYADALSSGDVADNYAALSWTDITADTKGVVPLVLERGIRDDKPNSRVASTGICTFAMNNLASNSGGVTGYYSPGHASCRVGFKKGAPIRVKQGSDIMFLGRVRVIAPTPGRSDGNLTKVLATDFMDTAATFLMENAPILEDVTGDVVFRQVLGLMTNQPAGVITFTGSETYTLALDNTRDEAVTALQEFHRLAVSELGYVYVLRDGRIVYEARGTRVANEPVATVTLTDTMHGLDVAEVSSSSLNRVQITVHPRDIDAAATTVLFELVNPLQIAAGEVKPLMGPYRTSASPGITTRVGGLNMVTPVATTDYTMNAESDGTGADLTASLGVVANFGANGVRFELTNNAPESAYITKLQCRGKGVYDFRTVVSRSQNDAAIAADGVNALTLDMVYQEDPNVAQAMADSLLSGYGDLSGTRARMVWFYPDAAGMPANLYTKDISDRIAVSETVTGATGDYYINGVKHEYANGTLPRITWWLTPAEPVSYWVLGLVGASELGVNTVPAPG